MKKFLLSIMTFTLAFVEMNAQLATGDYLIQNVENGQYFGGGNSWGTRASVINKPQFFTVTMLENGKYTLDSHQGGGSSHFLGDNMFVDSEATECEIKEVNEGEGIYTISNGSMYYYAENINGEINLTDVSTSKSARWKFITMDEMVASMETATLSKPVDVTFIVKNPELKRNFPNSWTVSSFDGASPVNQYAEGWDDKRANLSESYHSNNGFKTIQTITLPKAGKYTLSAQAFYRQDDDKTEAHPYLFAGDKKSEFPVLTGVENDREAAYQSFLNKAYTVTPIEIFASEDNYDIEIGFAGEATNIWNIFGEVELMYYGNVNDDEILKSSLEAYNKVIDEIKAIIDNEANEPLERGLLATLKEIVKKDETVNKASKDELDGLIIDFKSALEEAKASVEVYKATPAYIEKARKLDADGIIAFADIVNSYNARTLATLDEVKEGYIAAVKAQTTPGIDITEAVPEKWEGQTNYYKNIYAERYGDTSFEPGKVMYHRIEGLRPGFYGVEFIASANLADWVGQTGYGEGIAQVFVNGETTDIEVELVREHESFDAYIRSYTVEVGEDGVLEFGIQNVANGGCWYVCKTISLVFDPDHLTAINDAKAATTVANDKFFEDGKVVIVKNGVKYNVNGTRK